MNDISKDIFGIVTLVLGAACLGLVLTHAGEVSQLASTATAATSQLAETITNPQATNDLSLASFGSGGAFEGGFGNESVGG